MKLLILFGHPAFEKSSYNKAMLDGIEDIENITFHDLYETYPEMDIDREKEQELLLQHDCIIFHHPMYWYSAPAIFKEWQDLVLTHGWAYGSQGSALKGKYFMTVTTTGAPQETFCSEEYQHHTIREFLVPYHQMAIMCKMIPLPPLVIHGTHQEGKEHVIEARDTYHRVLKILGKEKIDLTKVMKMNYINQLEETK